MSDFYIASLKHTNKGHEHITFWGPDCCGYRLVIAEGTGRYSLDEAMRLNNGIDYIAVPVEAVKELLSPEPYFRNYVGVAARVYDTPGPVVDNTRANWNRLIANSLKDGRTAEKVKPEPFRGTRRSFALAEPVSA